MANMFEYLDWRGDLPFAAVPPDEADYLIFSAISYIEMNGLYTESEKHDGITVRQLYERYEEAGYHQEWSHFEPKQILQKAAAAERFKDVRIRWYRERTDDELHMQFAAMTFSALEDAYIIAFRGTDDSFTGWREDFYIACMDQVMAQKEAVRYVEEIAAVTEKPLILCGHSKGGNLAMYADMYASEETRERIPLIRVYDSPGFRREIAEGSRMAETAPKTLRYLPDTSLVGLLMFDPTPYTVVSSKVAAGSSHNPFNWQILGEKLVREEKLTALSEYLDEVLDQWLDSVPDSDRLRFIDTLFNAVDASGVQFADLEKTPLKAYPQIISQLASLSDEMKDQVLGVAGKLAKAGKEVLFSNVADAIRAQAEKLKNS